MNPTQRTMLNSQAHIVTNHVTSRITSEGEGKRTRGFELGGSDELSAASKIKKEGSYAPCAGPYKLHLILASRGPGRL